MRARPQRLWLPALPQREALRKGAAGGDPLSWEVGDGKQRGTMNAHSEDAEEEATAKRDRRWGAEERRETMALAWRKLHGV